MLWSVRIRLSSAVFAGGLTIATVVPVGADQSKILPGAVIRFTAKTAACLSREDLLEYKAQTAQGDKRKIQALFFEYGGRSCVLLPPDRKFKVISADYNPGSPVGILEIVAVDAVANAGTWTFSDAAILVGH